MSHHLFEGYERALGESRILSDMDKVLENGAATIFVVIQLRAASSILGLEMSVNDSGESANQIVGLCSCNAGLHAVCQDSRIAPDCR